MDLKTDLITTVVIGMLGALIGGLVLRFLLMLSGVAAGFVGAILGAMVLIWAWKAISGRK